MTLHRGAGAALVCVCLALLASCGARGPDVPAATAESGGRERISATAAAHMERTFSDLLRTLEENYVHGPRRSVDWQGLRDRFRPRIGRVTGVEEFAVLVREALAEINDPDVLWQSRAERIEIELSYATGYEGIGTYIAFRQTPLPRVLILEIIPGSPAERAGLRPHDAILSIEGSPVLASEALTVAERIRGPRGTPVRLEIARPGGQRGVLSVTRDRVELTGVVYPTRSGLVRGTRVGYIQFPRSASAGLAEEVVEVIQRLSQTPGLTGLILDLRISGSGAFPLVELLGMFSSGFLGTTYTAQAEENLEVPAQDSQGSQTVPLAVVVGPDTGGLSEILAAALQAKGRARVVGWRTPGTVENTEVFGLVDGSRLTVPVWSYRAPNGVEVGLEGVIPDVAVDVDWDGVTETADPVREAAARALGASR